MSKGKLSFLINRTNYYRFYTPIIREAIAQGYDVECLHYYENKFRTGPKAYLFADIAKAPDFKSNQVKHLSYEDRSELSGLLSKSLAVVSYHFSDFFDENIKIPESVQPVLIMMGGDSFIELKHLKQTKRTTQKKILTFLFTPFWVEKAKSYFQKFHPHCMNFISEDNCEFVFSGSTEMDLFNSISAQRVRDKFKLEPDNSIFIYFPFAYLNRRAGSSWERAFSGKDINTRTSTDGSYLHLENQSYFKNLAEKSLLVSKILTDPNAIKTLLLGHSEVAIFKSIVKFCKLNNLKLFVKPRQKFPIPRYIQENADHVVWDDESQQDPPVLQELYTIARLSFSYMSSSVLSAVVAHVPHVCMDLPEYYFYDDDNQYWYPNEEGSFYQYNGVSYNKSIEDLLSKFSGEQLNQYRLNESSRSDYIKKYISPDISVKSSTKIINTLNEKLL